MLQPGHDGPAERIALSRPHPMDPVAGRRRAQLEEGTGHFNLIFSEKSSRRTCRREHWENSAALRHPRSVPRLLPRRYPTTDSMRRRAARRSHANGRALGGTTGLTIQDHPASPSRSATPQPLRGPDRPVSPYRPARSRAFYEPLVGWFLSPSARVPRTPRPGRSSWVPPPPGGPGFMHCEPFRSHHQCHRLSLRWTHDAC